MLIPDKWNTKSEVIDAFEKNDGEFEVVLALAKVGWAFCQIHTFENNVSGLILIANKVKVGKTTQYAALDASAKLLLKREKLNKTMLGQMVGHLKQAGFSERNSKYMERLVTIRNNFIHRFSENVPLPGDWERYNFDAKQFASYPQDVGRRFERASNVFPKFMVKAGLLEGQWIGEGMLMSNPVTCTDEESC